MEGGEGDACVRYTGPTPTECWLHSTTGCHVQYCIVSVLYYYRTTRERGDKLEGLRARVE